MIAAPETRTIEHIAEEMRWGWRPIPKEFRGKIVSLKELKNIFPQTEEYWRVRLSEEHEYYDVYSRPLKEDSRKFPVAYECKSCSEIVVGPPRIESDRNNILFSAGGREIYCTNCGHNLEGDILDRMNWGKD